MEETNDRRAQPEPRLSQNDAGGSKGWGKRLRDRVPSDAHAGRGRVRVERTRSVSFAPRPAAWQKDLVTLDYGGMLPSRSRSTAGSAGVMAADFAETLATGIHVQVCGDYDLMNFHGCATPERQVPLLVDPDRRCRRPGSWPRRSPTRCRLVALQRRLGRGKASRLCPCSSDVDLFGYGESVIDLNAEIPHRALYLLVAQEKLHSPQVASTAVDECRLGSAQ
jgi:Uncharacterized protein conserved in bacteria (DUF2252)